MAGTDILRQIKELVLPILEDSGLELVDLEFKQERGDWYLRIFIDKPGGVVLDDCAEVSRELDGLLEVEGVIRQAFRLEISSPGLDRPLKKAADFSRYLGEPVRIKTFQRCDPDARGHLRKTFQGRLERFEGTELTILQTDKKGGEVRFDLSEIAQANLDPQFD